MHQSQSSKGLGNITHFLELASGSDSTGAKRYKTRLQYELYYSLLENHSLEQGLANLKVPVSKYFRLCRLIHLVTVPTT